MLKKAMIITTLGVVALAVNTFAQGEKKAASKKGGAILHPEMTVETGSYGKPAGTLGEKPAQPWSATTVGASVDGKAQPGQVTTLTGEIVDFSCYLQVGKHGEKHRACGQKCFTNGQPIGLLTQDGSLYMLMEEEHDPRRDGLTEFRKAATEHVAHIMEVSGTEASHGGYKALFVTGFLKK
jgi:hypothetical protein